MLQEDLIAIVRSVCDSAQGSSSKRITQVKAWAMYVLALEAHRRGVPRDATSASYLQMAPDDLLTFVRTLPPESTSLLLFAIDQLTQLQKHASGGLLAAAAEVINKQ